MYFSLLQFSAYVLPAVLLLTAGLLAAVFLIARRRIRTFSRKVFGTDSLLEGFERQAAEESQTPRSVSAMTSVYLPKIAKDFPEFSWNEFRKVAENLLIGALRSVSEQRLLLSEEQAGANLCGQIRSEIAHDQSLGIVRCYKGIKVHRTEISRYSKHKGTCVITLQSAVEYIAFTKKGEAISEGSETVRQQVKYESELVYVQDSVLAGQSDNGVSVICPNCGAPVTDLGYKNCAYCGSAVTEINLRVWRLNGFRKIN